MKKGSSGDIDQSYFEMIKAKLDLLQTGMWSIEKIQLKFKLIFISFIIRVNMSENKISTKAKQSEQTPF